MSAKDALATGLVGNKVRESAGCTGYRLTDNPAREIALVISDRSGVVKIFLSPSTKTSRGIGAGAAVADVKKAYPTAKPYRAGLSAQIESGVTVDFKVAADPFTDSDKVAHVGIETTAAGECDLAFL